MLSLMLQYHYVCLNFLVVFPLLFRLVVPNPALDPKKLKPLLLRSLTLLTCRRGLLVAGGGSNAREDDGRGNDSREMHVGGDSQRQMPFVRCSSSRCY